MRASGTRGPGRGEGRGLEHGRWRGEALLPEVREILDKHFGDEWAEVMAEVRCHGGGFARWLTRRMGAGAVALGRRVYFSEPAWRRYRRAGASGIALAAHEATHILQYRRHGLPRMLARYVWQYLRGRLRGLSHARAYRAIDYEREAFAVEAEVRRRLEEAAQGGRSPLSGR